MNARIALWMAVMAAGAVVVAWLWLAPKPVSPPQAAVERPSSKKPVKVASDRDWNEMSAEDLREFSSWFGDAKNPRSFEVDEIIVPGEAVVAEVYEATPGELVFTKLTPTLKTNADGTRYVEVALDSFSVTTSGEFKNLLTHQVCELRPGDGYTASSIAYGEGNLPKGLYSVGLGIEIEDEPPSIRLKAAGDYQGTDAMPGSKDGREEGAEDP